MITDWLTAIGTIGATVVALLLAIVGDRIRWSRLPRLSLVIGDGPPDRQNVDVGEWNERTGEPIHPIDAYRVRASINNSGSAATNVEVRLMRVEHETEGGQFIGDSWFVPSNLRWADSKTATTRVIHRNVPKQCDLLQITEWEDQGDPMRFELLTVDDSLWYRQGRHRLFLAIACDEVDPVYRTIEILYDGEWAAAAAKFFRDHMQVRVF